ncbi:TetR/AcrR family transcriptional regulator [Zavarzinia compransoris]|uniref:TetR/AcrR family transcriptional regulator n=1 Tax=Zavarzinia marina TaxID=2911065 RepID=UPI001F23ABBB|nr:TetR/AcrR family transcriptional regulator [Zavarzinia marina]MCF4165056.1 TetR/AcrR family transcriptional regulator [Zavarzinia marina]
METASLKRTAKTPPRRRMSLEKRRGQIMDAARDVAVTEGFHAVTLERIARACGITRTLIYQQFGNLPGLLLAMVDREFERAGAGFERAAQRPPARGQSRFAAGVAGVLEAVDAAPATWRMLLMPSQGGPPELHERLEEARHLTRAHMEAAMLTADPDLSHLANPDRELAIRMLHAVSEDLVRLRLTDPETYSVDRLLVQAEWLAKAMFARA